ncbi:sulfatase-like hydrolase/transferase [Companilactobacillus sp. DQM5]|uniref:sulfatase-like hydrolase/transferase n=1 Tax=Companilactobacillus sp. DQM5 TaxID=3463359 RepID=UPI004059B930
MFYLFIICVIIPLLILMLIKKNNFLKILIGAYLNLFFSFFVSLKVTEIYLNKKISTVEIFKNNITSIKFIFLIAIIFLTTLFIVLLIIKKFFSVKFIKFNNQKHIRYIIPILLFTLGFFLLLSALWENRTFGLLTPEQIIYNLTQPMEGADNSFLISFLKGPLLKSIIFLFVVSFFYLYFKNFKVFIGFANKKILIKISTVLSVLSIILSLCFTAIAAKKADAFAFYSYLTSDSTYIKNNYVKPDFQKLKFPKKKRNLIYIYCESLESTTISKELGGQWTTNLMPELTTLSRQSDSLHFSDTDKEFGGAQQLPGTGWTVAGMVAQSSGLPLKVPTASGNDYSKTKGSKFLPGVISLNDILSKEGYNQTLLLGSDSTFGGRKNYFQQHGIKKIDDLNQVKKEKRLPKKYHVYWGFEDSKLFNFAKEDLTTLSQSDKPFNLTMLTENTHFIGGYAEKDMPKIYNDQYSNVVSYSDHQLVEFVNWIKTQPFYQNTTIVIHGDHLSMDPYFYQGVENRRTFNLIINGSESAATVNTKNREFSTLDMFPTTLAELNVEIPGDRLGLGTNLLSNKKTLIERDGFAKVNKELSKRSTFYNKTFMNNK